VIFIHVAKRDDVSEPGGVLQIAGAFAPATNQGNAGSGIGSGRPQVCRFGGLSQVALNEPQWKSGGGRPERATAQESAPRNLEGVEHAKILRGRPRPVNHRIGQRSKRGVCQENWSAAKGGTTYKYDPVGNLTNVVYPVSPAIKLQYDALNRLRDGNTESGEELTGSNRVLESIASVRGPNR
jgi:hypothetical protein